MGKVDLIYQAIKAGVSAPKIIAKYGKKAYDAAKKSFDKLGKNIEKSKLTTKLNKPIFNKALQKDIKVRGRTVRKGTGEKISEVPSSTPYNPNKVTWREWKDATRRNLLETTPAELITTAVVPPSIVGGSVGAAALLEKVLGKKDKKKEKKLEKNRGGSVNSRAIAKKYFKGGMV